MLTNLDRKIKIVVYQNMAQKQMPVYSGHYCCVDCKNVLKCESPEKCGLAKYVQERMSQTFYSPESITPNLKIVVANEAEQQRALKVVERAQRLRTSHQVSR